MTKSIYNKQNGRFEDEEANAGGAGTVTSVGLSVPSIFTASGSPVTSSGTLGFSLNSQSANRFLASPNGSAGLPTFRAIATADLPTGALPMLTLLDSVTVSGAAVTSVQLDPGPVLTQGEQWIITGSINQAAGTNYYLEYNGDTTATNYYSQVLQSASTTTSSNRTNDPLFAVVSSGDDANFEIRITRDVAGYTRALAWVIREDAANVTLRYHGHIWNKTTDPSSIEIVAVTASGIGIGSWFRLYKLAGS